MKKIQSKNYVKAEQSEKLSTKERSIINSDLINSGMDGNGRFSSIGEALGIIADVLSKYDLNIDAIMDANYFRENKGSRSFDLARINNEDPFSPGPAISNSNIRIGWEELSPDKYEIVAYIT